MNNNDFDCEFSRDGLCAGLNGRAIVLSESPFLLEEETFRLCQKLMEMASDYSLSTKDLKDLTRIVNTPNSKK